MLRANSRENNTRYTDNIRFLRTPLSFRRVGQDGEINKRKRVIRREKIIIRCDYKNGTERNAGIKNNEIFQQCAINSQKIWESSN